MRGRASSLEEMIGAEVPLPPGFVVTTRAYQESMQRIRLFEIVDGLLGKVNVDDSSELQRAASQIQQIIVGSRVPGPVEYAVREAYRGMGKGPVDVYRIESANGLTQTCSSERHKPCLIGTRPALRAIRACWASLFEARAIFYRVANGIQQEDMSISVAVQRVEGATFWLKSCPKCSGDLYADHDQHGAFNSCIQCGYYLSEAEQVAMRYAWVSRRAVEREWVAEGVALRGGRR